MNDKYFTEHVIQTYKTILNNDLKFLPALGLGSPKLKVEVKNPKGKAPIPNDIWNPPSPNPKPWKAEPGSGSDLCPAGLGGTFSRGSSCLLLPRPYSGTTLSLLMAALQTGHT